MNVKTIVTIALIGLLGVGTAAGIFLSDRSQQQEPPSADIQQEEKAGSACGKLFSKGRTSRSSPHRKQNSSSWRRNLPREKEEYYLLLANAETRCRRTWSIRLKGPERL